MSYISVCTPTFNRAHLLRRPFDSLRAQTFRDFEWVVIDDGSTDNTEEIIRSFIQEADFPIVYVKQENKGRAAALNLSYQYISAPYVINLDSDDELVPEALARIHDIWEKMTDGERERFWCITGQCIESNTREIVGGLWPEGINALSGSEQHRVITKYKKGEKSCCRKLSILKKNLFPQFEDTKFVPENIVWETINKKYDQFCTNEVFRIYYTDSPDSLSKGKTLVSKEKRSSGYYYSLFLINECIYQFFYNKEVRIAFPYLCRCAILSDRKLRHVLNSLNSSYSKIGVLLCWPLMKLYATMRE